MLKIIHLDDQPQVGAHPIDNMCVYGASFEEEDSRIGARGFTYRGGNFVVYPNWYACNGDYAVAGPIRMAMFRAGIGTFSLQVNYAGACMATTAFCRALAIRECKRWIDEYILRYKATPAPPAR